MLKTSLQILLATYNSEKFIRPQLDSLLNQTYPDFEILISDAGSVDATWEILGDYQSRFPGKIRLIGKAKTTALENFSSLLAQSSADLLMFCDHDDVWKPDKILHSVENYKAAEKRFGSNTPILLFTDSEIVDEELRPVADSMLKYQNLDAVHLTLNRLILQNVPSGNTMLFNRALADLALPVPSDAVMHDHWITLVAATMGRIVFLDEATVLYRQHSRNVYGAFHYSFKNILRKGLSGKTRLRQRLYQNFAQAVALKKNYAGRLRLQDLQLLQDVEHFESMSFFQKIVILHRHKIKKTGLLRNIAMLWLL